MAGESIHSQVARYQAVQLDGEGEGEYFSISFLRLSPDVLSVINMPEKLLSQMNLNKQLVKSKN